MEKFSKETLKKLANQVMFDLSDTEMEELQIEFGTYLKQIDLIDKINTEDVLEMVYPFEQATTYIRNDEDTHMMSQDEALFNSPKSIEGHVVVPKVVK